MEPIAYTLRFSRRARRLRLMVRHDGNVVVSAPTGMPLGLIEGFLLEKARWVIEKLDYYRKFGGKFLTMKDRREEYIRYKTQAFKVVEESIAHLNKVYRFRIGNIRIKNHKSRWGSCSKNGNLNFHYRIALLPKEFAHYIVAHELCHLGEFNHSKKFWMLVEKTIPNYAAIRKKLRRNGM